MRRLRSKTSSQSGTASAVTVEPGLTLGGQPDTVATPVNVAVPTCTVKASPLKRK